MYITSASHPEGRTVKVDAHIAYNSLREVPDLARAAEQLGLDGIWFSETAHDPFLGAALAVEHTTRVSVGTSVAVAFSRSPTLLAYLGWDLATLSGGRFMLGLGTQVKAHVVRRFGMPWDAPAPRLRETVQAIRAVWQAWQTGTPLSFRGRFFTLTLMTPFFSPPGHDGSIPILTAGVNPRLCRVAGEVADGFLVHPFHTAEYLRSVVLPAIHRGRIGAGRGDKPFAVSASVFAVSGDSPDSLAQAKNAAKQSIAFYASTPSYRRVLDHHGWTDLGLQLSALAARSAWNELGSRISDEMLETVAVVGRTEEIGPRIMARYEGLVDRIGLYEPFTPAARPWQSLLTACHA